MANATANVETVVTVKDLTLTLTEDEVYTLLVIANRIGGCPRASLRKHVDAINDAIHSALGADGVDLERFNRMNNNVSRDQRSIYFKDNE